jgi:branched-chain amino acid transport system ATP-binding protein
MIEIAGLTVRFGGLTALSNLDVTFSEPVCGLIGPNGSGKTTLFNVLSGFVTPAEGEVRVDGKELLAMPHYRRARWGVRRTFQTEQTIANMSLFDNVGLVAEQQSATVRGGRRQAIIDALNFVGLADRSFLAAAKLDVGRRRLLEIAKAVVGSPRIVLLDEPGAGLAEEESAQLIAVVQEVPSFCGAQVILVDHDMSVVSGSCSSLAVLDFGHLIASGKTSDVLYNPDVVRAYLGVAEETA